MPIDQIQLMRTEILKELRNCGKYQLPESTLLAALRLGLRPAPTMPDFTTTLTNLSDEGLIISTTDTMTKATKWRITDLGKSLLSENGL